MGGTSSSLTLASSSLLHSSTSSYTSTITVTTTTTILACSATTTNSQKSSPTSDLISVTVTPTTTSNSSSTSAAVIRGVNLGGWLVLEKWMNSDAFQGAFASAVDQWTFDSIPGAAAALQTHWSSFITQADIQTIASTGINTLRIPIGFWAYDNAGTPYLQGADVWLDKAISWARAASMKVLIDVHGLPGSQNGYPHSGHAGAVMWQQGSNLARSITVLQTIAKKYGSMTYADVVMGLELVNEPISWGNNSFITTQNWTKTAYAAVHAAAANPNLVVVMHDAFEGPGAWSTLAKGLAAKGTFAIDSHLYQLYAAADNNLTQAQHIQAACAWSSPLAQANAVMPVYVGEFSVQTNICVNPDGSTTAGTSCTVFGCQCQAATDIRIWNANMTMQARKFVEAQLDVFESSASGWFLWSAKAPGGWGFLNALQAGVMPNPVTSRMYSKQCSLG